MIPFTEAVRHAARMMTTLPDNTLNCFTHRITNARAGGINSKIASVQKMAYGFRNKEHLKTAIYFRGSSLRLYV